MATLKNPYSPLNKLTPAQPFKIKAPTVSGAMVNQPVQPAPAPRPTAPVAAPTPAPAPVAPTPAPATPAAVYGPDLGTYNPTDAYDTALANRVRDTGNQAGAVVNEQQIYRDKLKQYQKEIDAVNGIYREKLRVEGIAGQGRLGTGRASQGRAGLLGSDFAAAQNDTIGQNNSDIANGIRDERQASIQAILGNARKDAADELAAKRLAKEQGADAYLKFLGEQSTRRSSKLDSFLSTLGDTDLSNASPTNLAEVAKSYGITVDELKTKAKAVKDAAAAEASEADLKTRKSEAEINKINADIASGKLITIGEGTTLYNTETGETFKNPKTYAPTGGGTGGGGGIYSQLDYRTANAVIAQGNKFAESPIVKTYNNLVSAANLISGVDPKSVNPADHQAIIYNFAKALDPDSVVREGEYETIKKYSQGLVTKYKGEINQAVNGTGFLSEQAIKDIQKATANRVNSYAPQYQNIRSQSANRINSIAGQNVADTVLLDFESGYTDPGEDLSGMSDEELMRYVNQ